MSQSPIKVWRKQKTDRLLLGKVGEILSWTEINVAPPQYSAKTPYSVVLVELENGEKIYGQLVDFQKVDREIGKKVRTILRRNGDVGPEEVLEYTVKFVPLI
ncbi:hypothetical protein CO051_04555 [Candidatus Roizmanbacteria bacterium CG_4_9_14_0_2_um_filter_39_13]|uniref:ChsH2 C-terminal OB-fold domain-containing protein n=1 Tax=Candidatus Roizmanbacteria bacterium CG_4_9_14_0_2_um_filter_39_13 TaxID=1974839 RepID=A0A2M8EXX1_9BACT|nr:MAG: hypothetical protein CO051_04555 [Candidatus Roizmanbacteria bacterium CG_4_9_14_0_2_um_filter_39_13]